VDAHTEWRAVARADQTDRYFRGSRTPTYTSSPTLAAAILAGVRRDRILNLLSA
jgi:hypothetical protein